MYINIYHLASENNSSSSSVVSLNGALAGEFILNVSLLEDVGCTVVGNAAISIQYYYLYSILNT